MTLHERLYALAATSEPDAAEELTTCADAAKEMFTALAEVARIDIGELRDMHAIVDRMQRRALDAVAKARTT